jgi:hypothetical protein
LNQQSTSKWVSFRSATTASFVGSKLVIESYKEEQLKEGDAIALDLLARQGWPENEITAALKPGTLVAGENKWSQDLRISSGRIVGIAAN